MMLFDVMHGDDVFVRDRGGRAGFANKAVARQFVLGILRIEHLDCHLALQADVEGPPTPIPCRRARSFSTT